METVLKAISDWIKSLLTAAIMSNLNGLFDDVNTQVGSIAQQVGTKPSAFEPRVFAMIEALSRNVVLPIAGIILTFMDSSQIVTMHVQSVDQNKAIKNVKRTITELDRSTIEEQKKAIRAGYDMEILPSDLKTYGRDL